MKHANAKKKLKLNYTIILTPVEPISHKKIASDWEVVGGNSSFFKFQFSLLKKKNPGDPLFQGAPPFRGQECNDCKGAIRSSRLGRVFMTQWGKGAQHRRTRAR